MRCLLIISIQFLSLLILYQTKGIAQSADIILTNGKIFTSDTARLYVQALAIKADKILAAGSNSEIEKTASAKTQRIDLEGKTVVPGFNDAHEHPGWEAQIGKSYNYTGFQTAGLSKADVLDSISRLVKFAKPGEWIRGLIGTAVFFETSMRSALDSIAPDNPVALQIWWGHGMVVNHKALEASGLSDSDKDPVGGWYIRHPVSNEISGLQQNAQAPVWIALNKSEPENLINSLGVYAKQQLSRGITSVQFMGTGFTGSLANSIFRKADLSQHIRIITWPRSTVDGRQLQDWDTEKTQSPHYNISGVKYVIDGSPMEENALRSVPYPKRPGWYGRLNYPIDTMKQMFKEALTGKRQLMMHITADSSFGIVLSLMKAMADDKSWRSKRVRIEHNCVGKSLTGEIPDSKRRVLRDLGILMMLTPKYCMQSPLRSLLDSGIIIGISPDGTTNPFFDIMLATTNHSNPKENLTREQAVIAFTKTNAFAEFTDHVKGTLKKGMLADLAVLSQDIFTIRSAELPKTMSVLTIVSGKIVYKQESVFK